MRPTEVLDLTSLTVHEFAQVVPPFEDAFQAHMAGASMEAAHRASLYDLQELSPPHAGGSALVHPGVCEDVSRSKSCRDDSSGWAKARPISGSMSCWSSCGRRYGLWGCPCPVVGRVGDAPRGGRGGGGRPSCSSRSLHSLDAAPLPPAVPTPVPGPRATMGPNGASGVPRIRLSRRAVIAVRKMPHGEKRAAHQCRAYDPVPE